MHSEEQRGETRAGPRLRPREWGGRWGRPCRGCALPTGLSFPVKTNKECLEDGKIFHNRTWKVDLLFAFFWLGVCRRRSKSTVRAAGCSSGGNRIAPVAHPPGLRTSRGSRAAEGCERRVRQGGARRRGARHLPGDRNGAAQQWAVTVVKLTKGGIRQRQRSAAAGAPPCCRWGCEPGGASGGQRGPGRALLIARQFRSGYSPWRVQKYSRQLCIWGKMKWPKWTAWED